MQPDPGAIVTFLTRLYDTDHNLGRELSWSDPGQDAIIHAERFSADDPVAVVVLAHESALALAKHPPGTCRGC